MAIKDKLRTVLISDVHGCLDELKELLQKLQYDKNTDRVILLGDLNDRGPYSVETIRYARELNLESVMGNHEFKFLKWFKSQGSRSDVYDKKSYYNDFSDEDINYIARMSDYIKLDDGTIVVHAGLKPGISLSHQSKNDLFYIRYMDDNSKFISLRKINEFGKAALGAHFWTEFWTGPESIVYGHNVHSFEDPLIEEPIPGVFCYGLDTGCCFGGKLTALIWETKEIVQVQAKEVYYKSDFTIR